MAEPLIEGPRPRPERIDALWTAAAPYVLVRERQRRARRRAAVAVGLCVLVGVGATALLGRRAEPVDRAGMELVAASVPSTFALPDGTRVQASAHSALVVAQLDSSAVRLELVRGRASFAVAKQKARPFAVRAGGVTVRVVGTQFAMTRASGRVVVEVEEGVVEVEQDGQVVRLGAAERWVSGPREGVAADDRGASGGGVAVSDPTTERREDERTREDDHGPDATGRADLRGVVEGHDGLREWAGDGAGPRAVDDRSDGSAVGRADPSAPSDRRPSGTPVRAASRDTADGSTAPGARAERPGTERSAEPRAPRARRSDVVFREAMEARQSGQPARAREALVEFVQLFPRDPRVGLVSFELGRLDMDVDHDLEGAVRHLQRALAAAPRASFAEDALARLARAHHGRGDRRACRQARAQYLERYPGGSYAAALAALCP